jgi:hypothetical protein
MDASDVPYLLAYKAPLCGPCETNALSQEGTYSEGGDLYASRYGTPVDQHFLLPPCS